MDLKDIENLIPEKLFNVLKKTEIKKLRPCQEKSIKQGMFENKNLLVCTPTGSGKTAVAEIASFTHIFNGTGKAIYIVPLKALASEKYKEFTQKYGSYCKIAMATGDLDRQEEYLGTYDLIICTSEKLDSLIRHHTPWLNQVSVVVIDEIHLINDPRRGPTLEILITVLKQVLEKVQIIGLSATIGNPQELAEWLEAELVIDFWRPVELKKGVFFKKIIFEK